MMWSIWPSLGFWFAQTCFKTPSYFTSFQHTRAPHSASPIPKMSVVVDIVLPWHKKSAVAMLPRKSKLIQKNLTREGDRGDTMQKRWSAKGTNAYMNKPRNAKYSIVSTKKKRKGDRLAAAYERKWKMQQQKQKEETNRLRREAVRRTSPRYQRVRSPTVLEIDRHRSKTRDSHDPS